MEDVIFGGSQSRPSRNSAEVTLFVDNSARTAPAEFNDSDTLEVTRRIEREAGSAYRVNGKDARARDIRLLFEDAATGARSPALVRQGRIGEIVNAPPQERRRVLEDAAGIAGLHSRRHEAELRLKATESNLERLGDLIGQLTSQLQALKRQARQAQRYREISGKIREAEALQHHLHWVSACAHVEQEEAAFQVGARRHGAGDQGRGRGAPRAGRCRRQASAVARRGGGARRGAASPERRARRARARGGPCQGPAGRARDEAGAGLARPRPRGRTHRRSRGSAPAPRAGGEAARRGERARP